MQHAEFAKIIALRLKDKPGLESLDPEAREEKIVEILEILDDREARSRWIIWHLTRQVPGR